MKLIDVIQSMQWLSVETTILRLYPDEQNNLEGYCKVFAELQQMEPGESRLHISIEDLGDQIHVSGVDRDGKVFSMEFTPWEKWLGMEISETTYRDFTPYEIVAHCMFEMTFIAFDQESISHEREELMQRLKQVQDQIERGDMSGLVTLDDFMSALNEEE